MVFQAKAEIISNSQVAPQHFKMVFEAPEIAREAQPGQFVHIRVHEELDPLLRRPFSIHRVISNQIEILYKIRGKATGILSTRKTGELLDLIGPLGNGFPLPERQPPKARFAREARRASLADDGNTEHQSAPRLCSGQAKAPGTSILVAGGIGVAPLLFLADYLLTYKLTNLSTILIGAKTKDHILCEKEFKNLCDEVKIATEDGSYGTEGLVTDILKSLLSTLDSQGLTLYASGPNFMLQEIKRIAKMFKILAFGSLEENIACGLGACFGCVVKTAEGYRRICKDGPVFNLEEIIWE